MRWPLATLVLIGCIESDPGTAVGNPGKLGVAVTDVPDDVTLVRADLGIERVVLDQCDDTVDVVPVGAVIDALVVGYPIDLPAGEYCGLSLVLDPLEPFWIEGQTDAGTDFFAELDPGSLDIVGRFTVDGNAWLVALPVSGFIDATELDGVAEDDMDAGYVEIEPGSPLGRDWADILENDAGLFEDPDAVFDDGPADEDADGADSGLDPGLEAGDQAGRQDGDACGCASSPSPWWLALWVLPLLARRQDGVRSHRGGVE